MIILEETDAESVHTLVQVSTTTDGNPEVPQLLAPLTVASVAFSVPPFVFALLNIPLSRLHTIPTLVAFAIGLHFQLPTLYRIWRLSRGMRFTECQVISKLKTVLHVSPLLALWVVVGIMSGLALIGQPQAVVRLCSSLYPGSPTCESRRRIFFILSTTFATLEIITLGTIPTLFKWTPNSPPSTRTSYSSSIHNSSSNSGLHFWKVPLTLVSLVFTIPPFIIALLNISHSITTTLSIPVIVAYILTTPFHVGIIILWRISRTNPAIPFRPLNRKRCISFVILLQATWLLTTVMSWRIAADQRKLLTGVCGGWEAAQFKMSPVCEARTQVYFTASTIFAAFEAVTLTLVVTITLTGYFRKRKMEAALSLPGRQGQIFKRSIIPQLV